MKISVQSRTRTIVEQSRTPEDNLSIVFNLSAVVVVVFFLNLRTAC